ncbi:class I SAM-dependent methyltransferase [Cellulomonas sp. Y8]|uniref:class I SAM-dependent methyltransferase n=1 Tax=Cellulomonas sp. Y8 TaxID=2591145 RepID=UPI003D75D67D
MPDAIFSDARLARLDDAFHEDRADLVPYRDAARELGARSVLDVGCGTGTLALALAADGLDVVGVDPASASLDVARTKDVHGRVRWHVGDATTLPPLAVDLAVMTGNVAQVFLDEDSWRATVRGIAAALSPGAHLLFETRRPEARAWEDWATETDVERRDVPGLGIVEQRLEVTDVALPFVSFRYTYRLPDGTTVESMSTLRFQDLDEVVDGLRVTGLDLVEVRDAADRSGRENVVLARRPA